MRVRVPDETEGDVKIARISDVRDLSLDQLLEDPGVGWVVDRIVDSAIDPAKPPVAAFNSAI